MKSIIKEIFLGYSESPYNFRDTEEYNEIYDKFNDVYEKIKGKLPEELREDFKLFVDLVEQREIEAADSHYVQGVKTGILLGIEACN